MLVGTRSGARVLAGILAVLLAAAVLVVLRVSPASPASAPCTVEDYHPASLAVATGTMKWDLNDWHNEMGDRGIFLSSIHYRGDRDIAESYGWVWDDATCTFVWPSATTTTTTPPPPTSARIVILGGGSAVSASVEQRLATCTTGPVSRIAGANRYATAAAVSKTFLNSGVNTVYVATGENFPDALAGSAAAGTGLGGPVLLVRPTSIPAETAAELDRLNPNTIVVLGGTAAISASVETALGSYGTVVRLAGTNRYSTGALVSSYAFPAGAGTAYVATGTNFPDALAGGPAAVVARGPVMLVDQNSIPSSVAAELTRLGLSSIKVLGGETAVSASVETSLKAYAANVTRLSGSNRYATAAAVSKDTFAPGVFAIFVATGTNFPDALAGGPIAGILGGPILLVDKDSIPGPTETEIERLTGITCGAP